MKKNIYIIGLFLSLLLFGCNQNQSTKQVITTNQDTETSIQTGILPGGTIIDGANGIISVSGYTLLYSGIFHIDISAAYTQREYLRQYNIFSQRHTDRLLFVDNEGKRSLSLNALVVGPDDIGLDDKTLCHREYIEPTISRSHGTKFIGGRSIYIDTSEFRIYTQGAKSTKNKENRFCFVDSGIVYIFSMTNAPTKDSLATLDSLYFY